MLSYYSLAKSEEQLVKKFINELVIVNINDEVKDNTIWMRKKYKLKLPDAIIAATALSLEATLLTNDSRFQKINEINCKELKLKA